MILVDGRVGSGHLVKLIRNAGAPVQRIHLNSGDISMPGNGPNGPISIGIEVKKPADLVTSLVTRRLTTRQLPEMRRCYDEIILAIVGKFVASKSGGIATRKRSATGYPIDYEIPTTLSWRQLQGMILSLQYGHQITFREFENDVELSYWAATTYKWFSREWVDHKSHLPSHQIFHEPGEGMLPLLPYEDLNVARFASLIPGFGFALARKVATVFSTIEEAAKAPLEKWLAIEGIGKKKAGEAWLFCHEKKRREG